MSLWASVPLGKTGDQGAPPPVRFWMQWAEDVDQKDLSEFRGLHPGRPSTPVSFCPYVQLSTSHPSVCPSVSFSPYIQLSTSCPSVHPPMSFCPYIQLSHQPSLHLCPSVHLQASHQLPVRPPLCPFCPSLALPPAICPFTPVSFFPYISSPTSCPSTPVSFCPSPALPPAICPSTPVSFCPCPALPASCPSASPARSYPAAHSPPQPLLSSHLHTTHPLPPSASPLLSPLRPLRPVPAGVMGGRGGGVRGMGAREGAARVTGRQGALPNAACARAGQGAGRPRSA